MRKKARTRKQRPGQKQPPRQKPRRQQAPPPKPASRVPRGLVLLAGLLLAGLIVGAVAFWQSRNGEDASEISEPVTPEDPGPVHVHGLGVNPSDRALFIATHTGLFRVAEGDQKAARVGGDRYQDTMGFTIVGPNRFLGSGHPDIKEAQEKGLPPLLGLIESTDAGENWHPLSLLGKADFHVLRFADGRVYGYDASNDRLLTSRDRGRRWNVLEKPGPLVDLAVRPLTPGRMVAASAGGIEEGLFESRDGGRSWKHISDAVGLLAWPAADRLYLVDVNGEVLRSRNGGKGLERRGEIGGQPAALVAQGPDELYVALHDGTIKRSTDGGASWSVRSRP